MFHTILIANRGEIACRVIETARRMGIRCVAVHSDADAASKHVQMADLAVPIGGAAPADSYLRGDRIIQAALDTGAQAIHPGYGFLSENPDFVEAVEQAGLTFIGPGAKAIRAMGLKDAAKALMQKAGVPVVPGYHGAGQDPAMLAQEAAGIGYPVLIKAVAGGGGKGMRLVEREKDFADALASARAEARTAFGNEAVLVEKYVSKPRHIEVQVFGDGTHAVHLFERDCSLQRRHQKVIEEAPAPGMDDATHAELFASAVREAQTVDYVGAGTIEFIADASEGLRADRIWFMEMNTRLQVEHPVTEEITGVDLVEWQLRVASGEPIPVKQEDLSINGWAMEARLYAEDPARGFLPSIGTLELLQFGKAHGGRIDTGVYQSAEVSPFYDPMIAKVIAHGGSREQAIERLGDMLSDSGVWPVKTNASFLVKALEHPDFASGDVDTGLIGRDGEAMAEPPSPSIDVLESAAMRLVPASGVPGFRLNAPPVMKAHFLLDGDPVEIELVGQGTVSPAATTLVAEKGQAWLLAPFRKEGSHAVASTGAILAPMPGKVIAVEVAKGDTVTMGQKLLTLEAMKMEHTLTAPFDGVVAELNATPGAQVQVEALLARIEEEGEE